MSGASRVAVIGTGAIGGCVAAALGDVGQQVLLCARTPFERLRRRFDGREDDYAHPVCTNPDEVAPCDWVLLCTKAYQVAGAGAWLDALIGSGTRVAVVQNGVDHAHRVAAWVSPDRVVPCIALLPCEALGPGRVAQERAGELKVPAGPAGESLAALFVGAGSGAGAIRVTPTGDFVTEVWKKLVINATIGAVCTLTLTPIRAFADQRLEALGRALIAETVAVGRAEGARIDDGFADHCHRLVTGPTGGHYSSITVDWREGRPMEWDARNAVVGRLGREHGIPTPYSDAMTALLAVADEHGGRFRRAAEPQASGTDA